MTDPVTTIMGIMFDENDVLYATVFDRYENSPLFIIDTVTIHYDGFVNGLQVIRFLSFLPSKLRGLWLLPRRD